MLFPITDYLLCDSNDKGEDMFSNLQFLGAIIFTANIENQYFLILTMQAMPMRMKVMIIVTIVMVTMMPMIIITITTIQ